MRPKFRRIAESLGLPEALAGRAMLAGAANRSLERAPHRGLPEDVIELLCEEFDSFAAPPPAWLAEAGFDHVRFREMARVATLSRFPAGQFQWELSGVPRSTLWKAGLSAAPALLTAIAKAGAFSPMMEFHVNERRRNRSVLLETEAALSYLRMARSLRLQPKVRGITTCSWLLCAEIARVTPRLRWFRDRLLAAGATLVETGLAPPNAGFLRGSEERRRLFERGELRPQLVTAVWPRGSVLEWAASYELERADSHAPATSHL